MHRKTLSISLITSTLLLACLSWWSVAQAIGGAGTGSWSVAIVVFSLLFVSLSLSIVLIREILTVELLLLGMIMVSFIFAPSFWHLLTILVGSLFIFWGVKRVRRDMELNVKIDLWKSLQMGRSMMIIGLAIIITSQYYFTVQRSTAPASIPHFETGTLTGTFTAKIMAFMNPSYKALEKEGITVDEFILQSQQSQTGGVQGAYTDAQADQVINAQLGGDISDELRSQLREQLKTQATAAQQQYSESSKELMLQQGRAQLAQMTGAVVSGNEKMSDVFSGLIDKKINDYFSPSVENPNAAKALPIVIAGILFFTIWPIGSFLSIFWILIAYLIFLVLVRLKVISVRKIPVEMEVID